MISIVCGIYSGHILNQREKVEIREGSGKYEANIRQNDFPDLADTL